MESRWIPLTERTPDPGKQVLVICDYRPWGRDRVWHEATVHFTEEPRMYGGPNALTGTGYLVGLFFALPAICAPGVVTHWMDVLDFPADALTEEEAREAEKRSREMINTIMNMAVMVDSNNNYFRY